MKKPVLFVPEGERRDRETGTLQPSEIFQCSKKQTPQPTKPQRLERQQAATDKNRSASKKQKCGNCRKPQSPKKTGMPQKGLRKRADRKIRKIPKAQAARMLLQRAGKRRNRAGRKNPKRPHGGKSPPPRKDGEQKAFHGFFKAGKRRPYPLRGSVRTIRRMAVRLSPSISTSAKPG